MQEYKTKIREKRHLTLKTIEITVDLIAPTDISFTPGQYVELLIGKEWKPYTICSLPESNNSLTFCIGLYDKGLASDFFREVKVGREITMRGPAGFFTVTDLAKNYLFVATGVGIAPFVSIVPNLLRKEFVGRSQLLFGVRHEEDVFYFDKFTHLKSLYDNFIFTPMLSQPKSHWPGEVGRVTTYLEVAYDYLKDYEFYICGATEMVQDARNVLLKKGHSEDRIKTEIFV